MKTAVIVGASKGIGLAMVENLLSSSEPYRVFATHRKTSDTSRLQALVELGKPLNLIAYDALEDNSEKGISSELLKQGVESVSLVVCALGVLHSAEFAPERKIEELEMSALEKVFRINSFSVAMVAKELKPFLMKSESARFAAISAKVGSITDNRMGGWYSYRASKSALNMLIKNIAIEVARRHKDFAAMALHPGTTETDLSKPFMAGAKKRYTIHSPEATAANLIQIVLNSTDEDNGQFFSWDGQNLPW
ncbi:MAG: SDR family NAD(P)-dependent oxidoreductase [Bdellovibrionales bacterium]|nr:SDR family NAD(P)-dependent oxidoreductase [Bdellovibrionales bacterium]